MRITKQSRLRSPFVLATTLALCLAVPNASLCFGKTAKGAKLTTLYTFTDGGDGGSPYGGVIRDAQGNLYGTTFYGGASGEGSVFRVGKSGHETVLYSFGKTPDGDHPSANLLRDKSGSLYGTNYEGGANGFGAVFKVDSNGTETLIYSFQSGSDGEYPGSGLIEDSAGNFYGTTGYGGASGYGTVFKISSSGTETILHSFTGTDGEYPFCTLVRDSAGDFYGTTSSGGASGNGTVFKMSKKGHVTVLHSFANGTDGATPYDGLVRDSRGNLYGTTYDGGAGCQGFGCGTVFRVSAKGKETVLHAFATSDGHYPDFGTLVLDKAGNLYGTTYAGGTADMGVIFKVTSKGKESILYNFLGGADEGFPVSGLTEDKSGNFYGTTLGDGSSTFGTVFKLKP